MPDPSGLIGYTELTMNDYATIDFCVEREGYRKKRGGSSSWCANHADANLPICQPGAAIPASSVKKKAQQSILHEKRQQRPTNLSTLMTITFLTLRDTKHDEETDFISCPWIIRWMSDFE